MDLNGSLPAPAKAAERTQAERKAGTRHVFRWLTQVNNDPNLTPLALRVAFFLTQFYNHAEGYARPSQKTLGGLLGCSRNGVKQAIDRLVDRGHVEFFPQRGRKNTCRYFMKVRANG